MEGNINKEIFTGLSPNPITIEGTEQILFQMKNCICKIHKKEGDKGTGFFCKIPIPNNDFLPVLITNNHVLKERDIDNGKIIGITINNDKKDGNIQIDEKRKKFTSKELDVTIVEIKPETDGIKEFLDVDIDINKDIKILEKTYKKKSIYILHYINGNNINVSYGLSDEIVDKEIHHICNTEEGSSGSPILSLDSFNVIGIHFGGPPNEKFEFNRGTLIKFAVEEFVNKVYNMNSKNTNYIDNKNNNKNKKLNEINIKYLIDDFDTEIKLFGKEFVKNNKEKCYLLLNDKKLELSEYINKNDIKINKKILKIKLKEIETITDMSYMFSKCCSLISLPDISEWDTSSVTNMKYMFDNCEGITTLPDISKWDISNVTDMSYMFNYCISLPSLPDISKWEISNKCNISHMFQDCKESLNIPYKFKGK